MKNRLFCGTSSLLVALLSMALAGCVASPIDYAATATLGEGEGIVWGRVRLLEGDEEQNLSSVFGESRFGLILLSEETSRAMTVPLKNDGTFLWHLAAGRYTIASYEWRSTGTLSGRIFAIWEVLPDRATYIGTLAITLAGAHYRIEVIDDYETALPTVRDRLPFPAEKLNKQLMKLEPRR